MVDRQIASYIERQKKAGYTTTQIKNALRQAGYTEKDISASFKKIPLIPIMIIIGVLIIAIGLTVFFLSQTETTETKTTPTTTPTQVVKLQPTPTQPATQPTPTTPFTEQTPVLPPTPVQEIDEIAKDRINRIVAIGKEEPERSVQLCEELLTNQPEKDRCHLESGVENTNPEHCKRIVNPDKKNSCHVRIALQKPERAQCNEIINNEPLKESCLNIVKP